MQKKENILVIIPAYNESRSIRGIIEQIKNCLPEADILVVNDGSTDNTSQTAVDAGASVLNHPLNMGYGAALQTGYKYAQKKGYTYILQMDADGQHEPLSLKDILKELKSGNTDVVIGSRFLHKESYDPALFRKTGMKLFGLIASVITGQKITDPTSGFQGYCRDVLKFLVSDYFPTDYPDADVIVMIHKRGFKIKEIPVVMCSGSGESMHSGTKPLYYIFKMMLSLFVTVLRKNKT